MNIRMSNRRRQRLKQLGVGDHCVVYLLEAEAGVLGGPRYDLSGLQLTGRRGDPFDPERVANRGVPPFGVSLLPACFAFGQQLPGTRLAGRLRLSARARTGG
jgi:hypothetical protein